MVQYFICLKNTNEEADCAAHGHIQLFLKIIKLAQQLSISWEEDLQKCMHKPPLPHCNREKDVHI